MAPPRTRAEKTCTGIVYSSAPQPTQRAARLGPARER
jgi:hypothetical protein